MYNWNRSLSSCYCAPLLLVFHPSHVVYNILSKLAFIAVNSSDSVLLRNSYLNSLPSQISLKVLTVKNLITDHVIVGGTWYYGRQAPWKCKNYLKKTCSASSYCKLLDDNH